MSNRRTWVVLVGFFVALNSPTGAEHPPSPTPTVSPARQDLAQYARDHALRKDPGSENTSIVISDENLEGYAGATELTAVTPTHSGNKTTDPKASPLNDDPRALWRRRVSDQLETIRKLKEEAVRLEPEIAELWQLFYRCDEPSERDDEIRPRLIHDIKALADIRQGINTAQSDLDKVLEEARKNGALPGWFRDLLN